MWLEDAIRARITHHLDNDLPLPLKPSVDDMVRAADGDPILALYATVLYMSLVREARGFTRHKGRHRWTDRERIQLAEDDRPVAEIAAELGVSEKTVRTQRGRGRLLIAA